MQDQFIKMTYKFFNKMKLYLYPIGDSCRPWIIWLPPGETGASSIIGFISFLKIPISWEWSVTQEYDILPIEFQKK